MFCNTGNRRRLKIGKPAYLLLPDGGCLYEDAYNGYGSFAGKDVYELVAEWNRDLLTPEMLAPPPERSNYQEGPEGDLHFERGKRHYQYMLDRLKDYKERCLSEEELAARYGRDWKREIGIDISCDDAQNAKLPFPIKISDKACQYSEMPASKGDPRQGCD